MTYTLHMRDEGGSTETAEIEADDLAGAIAAAAEEAADWARGGEWGDNGASVWVSWRMVNADGDTVDEDDCTVEIEPDHAALIADGAGRPQRESCGDDPDDHDWTGAGEGGVDENPGVWSTGGTSLLLAAHCRRCGLHRRQHVTGAQCNPGEHDTTEYRWLTADEIASHVANGEMN